MTTCHAVESDKLYAAAYFDRNLDTRNLWLCMYTGTISGMVWISQFVLKMKYTFTFRRMMPFLYGIEITMYSATLLRT